MDLKSERRLWVFVKKMERAGAGKKCCDVMWEEAHT